MGIDLQQAKGWVLLRQGFEEVQVACCDLPNTATILLRSNHLFAIWPTCSFILAQRSSTLCALSKSRSFFERRWLSICTRASSLFSTNPPSSGSRKYPFFHPSGRKGS